jgi:selenocysteine-specific elongation factor
MQHFIIGTAGHIDHGKTSLIKALTDMDCDTHPEEKKRGITINLGFAYLPLKDEKYLAFVDVPGHHRFISNMISGVSGIDFVMLIVAANDGVMPQTIEHLKICSLLGIKNGIVVINKKDMVDEDMLELCKEEIAEFVEGTFLENKPMFTVSSLSKDGIPELKNYLINENYELILKDKQDFFRMYVDRVFNVSGFGAVATGTVLADSVNLNDNIKLLPNNNEVRIRQIQRHGKTVDSAQQGSRVAINITGIKKREIRPGDILTKTDLPQSQRIDTKLSLLEPLKGNPKRFDAILLIGTYKSTIQVKLLDEDPEEIKENRFAQISLKNDWYFIKSDHFILRNTSSNATIGGGEVIDPLPLNHKKKSEKLLKSLSRIIDDNLAYIEFKVAERMQLTSTGYFVNVLQLKEDKVLKLIDGSENIRYLKSRLGVNYIFDSTHISRMKHAILQNMEKYHKSNPLSVMGVSKKKLALFTKDMQSSIDSSSNDEILSLAIEELENEKKLIRSQNNWKLPNQCTELSAEEKSQIKLVESFLLENGMNSFSLDDIAKEAAHEGIDEKTFKYIIKYLRDQKKIVIHGQLSYYSVMIDRARNALTEYLKQSKDGIILSQFRDLIEGNRKLAIQLFEIFEAEKLILRGKENVRFLNPNYHKIIKH